MEITREQAYNFWNYYVLTDKLELSFLFALPQIFNDTDETIEENHRYFHDDKKIRQGAKHLGLIINNLNLPDNGENNKTLAILGAGRAYVNYLKDQHNNDSYSNPGSFWLICCHIAQKVV